MRLHQIYRIRNIKNGKCYIGRSVNPARRFSQHKCAPKNRHLRSAFKTYGINNFTFEVIFTVLSAADAQYFEDHFILLHKTNDRRYGYNKSTGAYGGLQTGDNNPNYGNKWKDEQRRNLSEKRRGKPSGRKGIKFTEEHKSNIAKAKAGKCTGKDNPNFGNKWDDATREKLSRTIKDGRRLGAGNPNFGNKWTDQQKTQASLCNPSRGKTWITREQKNKFIPKNELDNWIVLGWIQGRCL